jgi:hypothetical protein
MVNDLEMEFKQHKKYSESIRRLKKRKFPQYLGKPGVLPPITDEEATLSQGSNRPRMQSVS